MVIIDQHALHERMMFELTQRIACAARGDWKPSACSPPSRSSADATPDRTRWKTLTPLLQRLGIEAAAMGPTTIGIHALRHAAVRSRG
jgi:DNA mismatch repair ATPase MutL